MKYDESRRLTGLKTPKEHANRPSLRTTRLNDAAQKMLPTASQRYQSKAPAFPPDIHKPAAPEPTTQIAKDGLNADIGHVTPQRPSDGTPIKIELKNETRLAKAKNTSLQEVVQGKDARRIEVFKIDHTKRKLSSEFGDDQGFLRNHMTETQTDQLDSHSKSEAPDSR